MKPRLIGIAGPSCAGKSELARWLARRTGAHILNLDHYYKDLAHLPLEVRARTNFDEPASVDSVQILADAGALAAGRPIHAPLYNFATHSRAPGDEIIEPGKLVILEGLFALYWPELRALFDLKLYVGAPDEVCYERRLKRDTVERGRTPESVKWQFEETVKPMAKPPAPSWPKRVSHWRVTPAPSRKTATGSGSLISTCMRIASYHIDSTRRCIYCGPQHARGHASLAIL